MVGVPLAFAVVEIAPEKGYSTVRFDDRIRVMYLGSGCGWGQDDVKKSCEVKCLEMKS